MQRIMIGRGLGLCLISLWLFAAAVPAQEGGFISSVSGESPIQELLPPEAVYEGGQVLHKITSMQENLHLLAGYYYGNPRLWKKIYQDNRNVIRNPNRLPVGQTLRIQVGEAWRPKFSYQEWFRLATRNGEWKPGASWQRTGNVAVPQAPQTTPQAAPPSEVQEIAPALGEIAAPEAKPPAEQPKEIAPAQEPAPAETTPTQAPAEAAPEEEKGVAF